MSASSFNVGKCNATRQHSCRHHTFSYISPPQRIRGDSYMKPFENCLHIVVTSAPVRPAQQSLLQNVQRSCKVQNKLTAAWSCSIPGLHVVGVPWEPIDQAKL